MWRPVGFKPILFVLLSLGACIGFTQTAEDYYQMALKALTKARESQQQGIANEQLWRTVISTAEMTLQKEASKPETYLIIAEAYESLGLRNQAWKSWQYAWLETNNDLALEHALRLGHELAEASFGANLIDASEKYYLALIELDPKDLRIYKGLAQIASKQGQLDKEILYWQMALKLEPDDQEALSALEALQTAQPQALDLKPEAIATATEISLEPLYAPEALSLYHEGITLYEAGEAYEARLRFIRAVELEPEFKEAWVWVGRTRFEQDSIPLAIQAFRRALALDPNNSKIQEQLAKAQARQ